MTANRMVAGLLALLGFGSALALGSGCAHRASKSPAPDPVADSVTVIRPEISAYGVVPVPFREIRQVRGTVPPAEPEPQK